MVTLQEVRDQLRLGDTGEDALLTLYIGAAVEYIKAFTRRAWEVAEEIPFSVKAAALLLVADLYENREAQGTAALYKNDTIDRLLWPHRAW
jgi:hypothetical protein